MPFAVVSNPEFLREGSAVAGLHAARSRGPRLDRSRRRRAGGRLYHASALRQSSITDLRTAEMIKYASNAFLATRISFINEIAGHLRAAGRRRPGGGARHGPTTRASAPHFLDAGLGFGGSCFPKDVKALMHMAEVPASTPAPARRDGDQRDAPPLGHRRLRERLGGAGGQARSPCWGLAFKPNTDDLREAPSLAIAAMVLEQGATVSGYDPAAMTGVARIAPAVSLADDPYRAATGADAVVLVTEWDEFHGLDFGELRSRMRGNLLIDGRNLFDPESVRAGGMEYVGIARVTSRNPSPVIEQPFTAGRGSASSGPAEPFPQRSEAPKATGPSGWRRAQGAPGRFGAPSR